MARRLPVIQPTAFERRAFLLGVLSTVAACASESSSSPQPRRNTGTGGGPDPAPKDGGKVSADGSTGGAEEDEDSGLPVRDAGADTADGAPSPGCAVVGVDAGAPASFAMGTLTYVAAAGAYVGRDAGGLYAMYALCTHTIGNMSVGATQLTCLVHGAKFTYTGEVVQGPATTPLPHFAVCLNSKGNVAIDSKVIVPPATRLVA